MQHVGAKRDKALARLESRGHQSGFLADGVELHGPPANPPLTANDPDARALAAIINRAEWNGHHRGLARNVESDGNRRAERSVGWGAGEREPSVEGPCRGIGGVAQLP